MENKKGLLFSTTLILVLLTLDTIIIAWVGIKNINLSTEKYFQIYKEECKGRICKQIKINLKKDEAIKFSQGKIFSPIYDGEKWLKENCKVISDCKREKNDIECDYETNLYSCWNYTVGVSKR